MTVGEMMMTKDECIRRLQNHGISWDYDLERDWCYSIANLTDDKKNLWIEQIIFKKKKKKINSNNLQNEEEKDEEWGDEYDYIAINDGKCG